MSSHYLLWCLVGLAWAQGEAMHGSLLAFHETVPTLTSLGGDRFVLHEGHHTRFLLADGLSAHTPTIQLELEIAEGKTVVVTAALKAHTQKPVLLENGKASVHRVEHCFYSGYVEGSPNSHAAFSTCGEGVKGTLLLDAEHYIFEPSSSSPSPSASSLLPTHVVYRPEDWAGLPQTACQAHGHVESDRQSFAPQSQPSSDSYTPWSGPTARHLLGDDPVLELLVISDPSQTAYRGGSAKAHQHALEILQLVESLFAKVTPKIGISLAVHDAWTQFPVGFTYNTASLPDDINRNFGVFMAQTTINYDAAQLLLGIDVGEGTAGLAFVGTRCGNQGVGFTEDAGTYLDSPSIGADFYTAMIMTHELSHILGLHHDGVNDDCDSSAFIMSAKFKPPQEDLRSSVSEFAWSSCSKTKFAEMVEQSACLDTAVNNVGLRCGDGILQSNEDCEPSLHPACTSNCKFEAGTECHSGACCDAGKFRPQGYACRPKSENPVLGCDLEEVCDGRSADCPPDVFAADETICVDTLSGASGICLNKRCASRQRQCWLFNEEHTYIDSSSCYEDRADDAVCEDLRCSLGQSCARSKLVSADDVYMETHRQVENGAPCPGAAVTDGTSQRVCMNGQCISLGAKACPNKCSQQGWCVAGANCVCDQGFDGLDCSNEIPCEGCSALGRRCTQTTQCADCNRTRAATTAQGACSLVAETPLRSKEIPGEYTTAQYPLLDASSMLFTEQTHPRVAWRRQFPPGWGNPEPLQLELEFREAFVLGQYAMRSGSFNVGETPSQWTIKGSNDGTSWTTLDTRSAQIFALGQRVDYPVCDNTVAYAHYRVDFEACRNTLSHSIRLAWLSLFPKQDGDCAASILKGLESDFPAALSAAAGRQAGHAMSFGILIAISLGAVLVY